MTTKDDIELRKHKWELLKKYATQIADFCREQVEKHQHELEEQAKQQKK